jgi:hypothetical protein
MAIDPLPTQRLRDLATDLAVERRRLEALVHSLSALAERWQREGADAERVDAAQALGLLLGFRHVVRHLCNDDLEPDQVRQRLAGALALWPRLGADLQAFDGWLQALIALAEGGQRPG